MEIGIWFGLLILFGILEAVTVSVVSIWFMAGSLAAILAALCGASLPVQIVLFLAVSVALLACLRPLVRKYVSPKITATNADRVIGKTAVVTESIDNIAAQGADCRRGSGSGGPDRRRKTLCHSGGGTRCKCKKIK